MPGTAVRTALSPRSRPTVPGTSGHRWCLHPNEGLSHEMDQCTGSSQPHRGGSDTGTGERHMGDAAGRGCGLDLVVLLEALQSVPEASSSAEQDRDHHDVQVVDEPSSKEVADHGGPPTDAYVLAVGGLTGR